MFGTTSTLRKFSVVARLAILSGVALVPSQVVAQEEGFCGRTYTIATGDTLSRLANRTFGSTRDFMRFYEDSRNEGSLGRNPNRISVGASLHLPPCPGKEVDLVPTSTAEVGEDPAGDPFALPIDIVTGTDYAPFTSQDLKFGGMLTAVVQETFDGSEADRKTKIVFINDWSSHLSILLPDRKYDFGFPWYRPNCSDPSALSDNDSLRCDLVWSDPLFSVTIGFYTLSTVSDFPKDFDDLKEKHLCRPKGYLTFDLEENGLIPGETIKFSQPSGVSDCFKMLENGDVDFVTINRFTAEKAIASNGLYGLVVAIDTIVSFQDLHLVGHKSNPAAARLIKQFNEGLKALQKSGRLSAITRYFMNQHQEEVEALRTQ